MKVTPCCKTKHWHSVLSRDIPDGIVRCELCDKMMDIETLESVERGLNPITFFCDRCFISAKTLNIQREAQQEVTPQKEDTAPKVTL